MGRLSHYHLYERVGLPIYESIACFCTGYPWSGSCWIGVVGRFSRHRGYGRPFNHPLGKKAAFKRVVILGGIPSLEFWINPFSTSTSYHLSLLLLFISGLGQAGFSIMQSSIILVESTDDMRSRTMGALVLAIGVGPLGRLQSGSMAEALTVSWAVGSMAFAAFIATLGTMAYLKGFIRGRS